MNTPEEQEGVTAVGVQSWIEFRCIRLSQPIGDFYIGAIDCADLVYIAYADIRRIVEGTPRDIEEFSGIQRPLSKARSKEIHQYVTTVDASFPTSVIVHIGGEDSEFDEARGVMRVRKSEYVAKILDGQHRIDGLKDYRGPRFELNTTIFVDMDMEDQALLFATINLKQTKVNKSLAYDLYEFATSRSPQKTCHNIARLLNSEENGPFYRRIKILGAATKGRGETLTQATFIDRLIGYISDDPMRDRDLLKRGKPLPSGSAKPGRPLCLRQLFKEEQDASIAKIISNYFGAVQDRWQIAWSDNIRGLILNRTAGFGALMRVFGVIYPQLRDTESAIVSKEAFRAIFERVQLDDLEFNSEKYLPGTTGEARLYQDFISAVAARPATSPGAI